jgi:lysophospholipase L1-like esterase
MRYLYLVAGLVVVGLAAYFFIVRGPTYTNYPSSGSDIIVLGDSLVYGTGSSKGKDFVSVVSGQVGVPIINLGVPGDTSANVLARLNELDPYKPKVVLLLVGGNDYLHRVPREETFSNISKIIENLQQRGAVVLLLGVRGGVLGNPFAPEFKSVSKKYHTAYLPDVLDGLFGNKEFMFDQVHPNDAGYARIAQRVAPELKRLLK